MTSIHSGLLVLSYVTLFMLSSASTGMAKSDRELVVPASHQGTVEDGLQTTPTFLRSDTLSFGYVDAEGFAIEGETWTFDHGGPDPLEGWVAEDLTEQTAQYGRHIDAASWSGHDNEVVAPILSGVGSAWIGAFQDEADALCWESGLGYGNSWRQRLASPVFLRDGTTDDVGLEFVYFNDTEEEYDYTKVILRSLPSGTETVLNGPGFDGKHGMAANPEDPPEGTLYSIPIAHSEFGGETEFQILVEVDSDGGWSDEDGNVDTNFGPFGFDDVTVSGAVIGAPHAYAFEVDLEEWIAETPPGMGTHFGIGNLADYDYENCECDLSGYVIEMHDEFQEHPDGQRIYAVSPPVDVLEDVVPNVPSEGLLQMFADWDQYMDLPRANGVYYRSGWDYYPFECEATGEIGWSGRAGGGTFFSNWADGCVKVRDSATANGVPSTAEQIRFVYELYASCEAFGIPPEECTGETNFSPLLDNVEIRFTTSPIAPAIGFDVGTYYRDGFPNSPLLSPSAPGNSDVAWNVHYAQEPNIRGDSLLVQGPLSSAGSEWEAKLWFRLGRKGPAQDVIAEYGTWRDRMSDGNDIENGEFAFAFMDSLQIGTQVTRNKFLSYLREDDDDHEPGFPEVSAENEILPDDVFVPGTQIEYFVTANFIGSSEHFLLPDTSGGNFLDFEILPTFREIDGVWKYPAVLYVDADNRGTENFIEPALNVVLHGALPGDPLPENPLWDKYDYHMAGWGAAMARGSNPQSTSGATLSHVLGYRAILWSEGELPLSYWEADLVLMGDWLTTVSCGANSSIQGLIMNGDKMTGFMDRYRYDHVVGATAGEPYFSASGDENYCVRLVDAPGAHFASTVEHDAWGNACREYRFETMEPSGSGVPSRYFENAVNGTQFGIQQVTNEVLDPAAGNYRSVISNVSYARMSTRESESECLASFDRIVSAAAAEIGDAMNWIFDGSLPDYTNFECTETTDIDGDSGWGNESESTQLFQNQPNPFNPRTSLSFQLGSAGSVELAVFDVGGRKVRTLISGQLVAGRHDVSWDGSDERGETVPAGVYWSQLVTEGYRSNKKMVVLR